MFCPWARHLICIASVDSAVRWVPGGDNLVKGVKCYELFGGISLKNHAFFIHYLFVLDAKYYNQNWSDMFNPAPLMMKINNDGYFQVLFLKRAHRPFMQGKGVNIELGKNNRLKTQRMMQSYLK